MSQRYTHIELNNGHDSVDITVHKHVNVTTVEFEGRDPTKVNIRFTEKTDLQKFGKALLEAAELME